MDTVLVDVKLEWDFEKSADLVRRFVDLRALNGSALIESGEVTGYVYYVLEENKGLVSDLYVRRAFRSVERENRLLDGYMRIVLTRGTGPMGIGATRTITEPNLVIIPQVRPRLSDEARLERGLRATVVSVRPRRDTSTQPSRSRATARAGRR